MHEISLLFFFYLTKHQTQFALQAKESSLKVWITYAMPVQSFLLTAHEKDRPEHMSGPTVNQPLSSCPSRLSTSPNCTSVTGSVFLSVR